MNWYQRLQLFPGLLRYRLQNERAELRFVLGRQIRDGSILDIGAHRGEYSYWMHRRFAGTRIVAFEPQPELAAFLADFKQMFRLARMLIEPVGLSSRIGTLRMHRPHARWDAATFDEFCCDAPDMDVFNVPVTTIDQYLAEHPELRPVRFIKCDVEHHEAEVLAGTERTLQEDRPELLVEWSTPRRAYRERLFGLVQRLGLLDIPIRKRTADAVRDRRTAQPAVLGIGTELRAIAERSRRVSSGVNAVLYYLGKVSRAN